MTSFDVHRIRTTNTYIYIGLLSFFVISIPLSEFGMSLSQFFLLAFWLWEGSENSLQGERSISTFIIAIGRNAKRKFGIYIQQKEILLFSSIFLIHIIGLLYTSDFHTALKHLRIKLPILLLPLLLSVNPRLTKKYFRLILLFFVGAVLAGTIISTVVLLTKNIADTREISLFISHIRFSLNICLAIFILIKFIFDTDTFSKLKRALFTLVALWLFSFLFILGSGTGIVTFLITATFLLIVILFQTKNRIVPTTIIVSVLIFSILGIIYINRLNKEFIHPEPFLIETIDKVTKSGNPYVHDTDNFLIEKGRYAGLFICEEELREYWNQKSDFNFNSKDKANQDIKHTIIRYLNSKNLRKDKEGVESLTDTDIKNIENGIANVDYTKKFSIQGRISKFLMSYHLYKKTTDPSRKSIIQRFEYWKASIGIVKDHMLIGVGTGDNKKEFARYYEKTNSSLEMRWRLRSHNQFLAITVSFGIIGLLWFLWALFYPPVRLKGFKNYYFLVFFIIAILSMITEDTLETQPGVTFFTFFYTFFLFVMKKDDLF